MCSWHTETGDPRKVVSLYNAARSLKGMRNFSSPKDWTFNVYVLKNTFKIGFSRVITESNP